MAMISTQDKDAVTMSYRGRNEALPAIRNLKQEFIDDQNGSDIGVKDENENKMAISNQNAREVMTSNLSGEELLHNNPDIKEGIIGTCPRKKILGDDPSEQFCRLFVGGLSPFTTEESLKDFYGKFGTIVDCNIVMDGVTKKSRGFGFLTYSTQAEIDTAMSNRPHVVDGKTVDSKRAVPRELWGPFTSNVSTQRLYVSGVRDDHTEEQFKNYFTEFGNVSKVEVIFDKQTGKPRGFGFVTFDDYDSVDRCVMARIHMINGFRCDVKKALSRDEMARAQQLERDRIERGNRVRGEAIRGRGQRQGQRDGPAGAFREPHNYGVMPPWGVNSNWVSGQWGLGGFVSPLNPYGHGQWSAQQGGYQPSMPGWSNQLAGENYFSQSQGQWKGIPY